jgi:hypothetical protein
MFSLVKRNRVHDKFSGCKLQLGTNQKEHATLALSRPDGTRCDFLYDRSTFSGCSVIPVRREFGMD